jgi:hypothetical protein
VSSDIVQRLGHVTADDEHCRCLKCEAADEITRLRAAGDALAEVADEWPELVEAWQEARTSASEITHAVVRRFEAECLRSDAGFGARSIDDTLPESEDIGRRRSELGDAARAAWQEARRER